MNWIFTTLIIASLAVVAVPTIAADHWQDCHHNAREQRVCRECWHDHETGHVRCGKLHIVPPA